MHTPWANALQNFHFTIKHVAEKLKGNGQMGVYPLLFFTIGDI